PAAPGEIGDLYISGVGLSPGYWRDPARTREVFLEDGMYRTGDLARVGTDGMIYLTGRSDSQIKSRGYRIELGEVEAAMHAMPGLRDAAVVAVESEGFEGKAICCAYVPDWSLTEADLSQQLARTLPQYMIPTRWMELDEMPHNANGKI